MLCGGRADKRCHETFCGLPDITLRIGYDHVINCPGPPGRLSALSVFYSKSVLCGAFVWARRALNSQKRGFSARAVGGSVVQYGVPAAEGDEGEVRF